MYIAGPLADRLEAFENLDLVGRVFGDVGGRAVPVVAGGRLRRLRRLRCGWLIAIYLVHVFLLLAGRDAAACRPGEPRFFLPCE